MCRFRFGGYISKLFYAFVFYFVLPRVYCSSIGVFCFFYFGAVQFVQAYVLAAYSFSFKLDLVWVFLVRIFLSYTVGTFTAFFLQVLFTTCYVGVSMPVHAYYHALQIAGYCHLYQAYFQEYCIVRVYFTL